MLELWSLTVEKLEEKVSTIDNLTLSLKFVHLFVCLLEGKGIHCTFYLCTAFELLKSATQQEHQTLIVEFQIKARKDFTRLDRGIRFSDWDTTQNNSTIAAIQICIGRICIECPSNPIPYKLSSVLTICSTTADRIRLENLN